MRGGGAPPEKQLHLQLLPLGVLHAAGTAVCSALQLCNNRRPLVACHVNALPQVSYKQATTTQLALHIPLEAAVNAAAVEQYKERQVG